MTVTADTPRATAREWIGLAALTLPCLLVSMDLTVLNLAVPSISAELRPSSSQLLWIVDIYGFLIAGSLITMGTLGDRIGRRRLLLIGAAAFGAASVLAAFSTSPIMLIATRAVLGVAGATLMPSTLSLIRNMFHDPAQRTFAIGIWTTSFSIGAMIGPLLGGLLLEQFWWGSVFLMNVPVMLLLLALGPILLPEFKDPNAGRFDLFSAALSMVAVLAVIYGIKRMAEHGPQWASALFIFAGFAVGLLFVRRQQRLADPLIDLRLFRAPAFSVSVATNVLAFFVMFGTFLLMAQYLQLVLGLSPLWAGIWTVPSSLGFTIGSMLTSVIARHIRPAYLIAGGLALAAVGFGVLTQVGVESGLAMLVIGSVIFSIGLAPVYIMATDMIVTTAPPERAGGASAISETGTELGGALGIAILGSIGTAIYRGLMADSAPTGVPTEVMEVARSTLGGALAVAEQLPDQLGAELLGTARAAFAEALEMSAIISVAITLALAGLAAILLRRVNPSSDTDQVVADGPGIDKAPGAAAPEGWR